ncbi:hypothetical protein MLD38_037402 [Melastoma candidum]|uniref:Uncharacterized protein n=1 Tax=Melastoma candidum TaxID=119954 RepID=A0ACB9LMY0_9MYRT|nr:hypothetical protein MLD38_037402 [Melastoma candidum]
MWVYRSAEMVRSTGGAQPPLSLDSGTVSRELAERALGRSEREGLESPGLVGASAAAGGLVWVADFQVGRLPQSRPRGRLQRETVSGPGSWGRLEFRY